MEQNPSRRGFLQGAGLVGAGMVSGVTTGALLPAATLAWQRVDADEPAPDTGSPRFTLAVIPDTQYLFDGERGDSAPLAATLRWLVAHRAERNIVLTAHLGDIVENGAAAELAEAGRVFGILDRHRMPYSVLAGNHDVDASTTDQRGPSPYLEVFGPHRSCRLPTYGGGTPDGYNTYHVFTAAGREWLLLALDWRPSDATLDWARSVLAAHPTSPAILTTHDLADADHAGATWLSGHGQRLWDRLVRDSDQIFLTLNGHYWPPGRTVLRNSAGRDVQVHIANYQDRYYGGGGMLRLYSFDLARNTIDVETLSPWILGQPAQRRNVLARREVELTDPANRFSLAIDFADRFAGFAPVARRAPRGPAAVVGDGVVAYWRFDQGRDGAAVPDGHRIEDLSGRGNHLTRLSLPGGRPEALRWSTEHHDDQPAHASLFFSGGRQATPGGCLGTVDGAPLNTATFGHGYTIEAFVKLPADVRQIGSAGMGILSRYGTGRDAGKTGADPAEPTALLGLSAGMALKWAVFPVELDGIVANWGHELTAGEWFHVAVVNDGRLSTLYVDGARLLRNPSVAASGLAASGDSWLVGADHRDRILRPGFYGWIGDIRIADRPLPVDRFLRA
ncbi:Tat pathway signal sequence domain protein [Plantactinospora sp. BC1]|uniref:LamG-like jellyroll fold domain-containing protein n=1 Tax=Plantactinospora sp. BC1 TaxID=2108470 RepID=UPI000D173454|nr:LamG-like jellyroll fold domain-containing protein [Plantactinospora sp. BC1]AVT30040.1 Tat pathway signal sequence domain protein [Plantactinospora sp. BC1]